MISSKRICIVIFNTQQIISSEQIIIVYASYLPLKEIILVVSYLYNPNIYLVICIISTTFNKHTENERKNVFMKQQTLCFIKIMIYIETRLLLNQFDFVIVRACICPLVQTLSMPEIATIYKNI